MPELKQSKSLQRQELMKLPINLRKNNQQTGSANPEKSTAHINKKAELSPNMKAGQTH